MLTQPTQEQSRLYWLKWIERQYAKADARHVKMRTELPAKEGEEDAETIDAPSSAGYSPLEGKREPPANNNGSQRR